MHNGDGRSRLKRDSRPPYEAKRLPEISSLLGGADSIFDTTTLDKMQGYSEALLRSAREWQHREKRRREGPLRRESVR